MKTLKVLGHLLTYPTADQIAALPEFVEILQQENWLPESTLHKLDILMSYMARQDLLNLQEEFVALFDRTPSLCLHLFEHVHGDSRDRGQALVDLSNLYKDAGLLINTEEMPDYLPLFLEYLSVIEVEDAAENLGEIANVLGVMAGRLKNRESHYYVVFAALIDAASHLPDAKVVAEALVKEAGNSSSFNQLDESWEEQNAFDNSLQTTGQDMNGACSQPAEVISQINISTDIPTVNREA